MCRIITSTCEAAGACVCTLAGDGVLLELARGGHHGRLRPRHAHVAAAAGVGAVLQLRGAAAAGRRHGEGGEGHGAVLARPVEGGGAAWGRACQLCEASTLHIYAKKAVRYCGFSGVFLAFDLSMFQGS